ncbi:hypothetical protein [Patulibacter minatonensis]|uniref:hypothetical protein n=1 Tax=Patulibacter minatonensis TaxID=298163 RepID=UPI00047E7F09|nr:hypothetical protein [Patulibacter minatonensis]
MADHTLAGKIGRVTGPVRTGRLGEVMLAVGDRVEAYYAVAYDGEESIERGAECVVVEPHPQLSRTVLVTAYPGSP